MLAKRLPAVRALLSKSCQNVGLLDNNFRPFCGTTRIQCKCASSLTAALFFLEWPLFNDNVRRNRSFGCLFRRTECQADNIERAHNGLSSPPTCGAHSCCDRVLVWRRCTNSFALYSHQRQPPMSKSGCLCAREHRRHAASCAKSKGSDTNTLNAVPSIPHERVGTQTHCNRSLEIAT